MNENVYAGFWCRWVSSLLDEIAIIIILILMNLFGILINFAFLKYIEITGKYEWAGLFEFIRHLNLPIWRIFLIRYLYYAFMEASKWQATLGKMALGVIVIDQNHQRISFLRATGRFWSKYLSVLTVFIGYMMAGFTKRKQALHDLIAKTYVVNKRDLEMNHQRDLTGFDPFGFSGSSNGGMLPNSQG
ncbi:RDD family protein [Paenibacillus sp. VCA1]|uniref:RDD family protein n=1 Tax=Paenibacillus sp. VCA1 TaxID=3039148 RepID=UPI0028716978|nr:RDD family protein [Paenibacillus sp. VCA1]MDR9856619.1 RDD family protein [Paenibacillus sp. VCA1]